MVREKVWDGGSESKGRLAEFAQGYLWGTKGHVRVT